MKTKVIGILLFLTTIIQLNFEPTINEDIHVLLDKLDELNLEMNNWEVTHVTPITTDEVNDILFLLDENYDIVKDVTHDAEIYIGSPKQSKDFITETIRIVKYPDQSSLQMTLTGDVWTDQTDEYYKRLTMALQSNIKEQNLQTYTCVHTVYSDTINKALLNSTILEKLEIVQEKEQIDTVEKSLYEKEIIGYSPLFRQTILVNNDAVNMQMIIKNTKNNKKQLIIGTPIILNEY